MRFNISFQLATNIRFAFTNNLQPQSTFTIDYYQMRIGTNINELAPLPANKCP